MVVEEKKDFRVSSIQYLESMFHVICMWWVVYNTRTVSLSFSFSCIHGVKYKNFFFSENIKGICDQKL